MSGIGLGPFDQLGPESFQHEPGTVVEEITITAPLSAVLAAPIDTALLERCAEAAYVGVMTQKGAESPPFAPWTAEPGDTRRGELPEFFKKNMRAAARAVLEVIR